ncbi:hypothetical protein [Taklimakanibacter albus]|uniref:Uncharacterized protein n=1 Tax=Taklimakanibacter albus TaxID=2800327 RepID=A0ACC5RFP4_9HYPH|nr:hypothetical protein [Aestuariivirga sp. YIM B02566]MBK1871541.1 hypothetical protein [Aestuariivirga sp. YIM B02566]
MKYILIILLGLEGYQSGKAVDHIEFDEKLACEVAKDRIERTYTETYRSHGLITVCVLKG